LFTDDVHYWMPVRRTRTSNELDRELPALPRSAGDQQCVRNHIGRWQRLCCNPEPRGRRHARAAAGHNFQNVRSGTPRPAGSNFVGRCEDLQRSRHVKQLNRRKREQLDDKRDIWREMRDIWHIRQSLRAYIPLVHPVPSNPMIPNNTHLSRPSRNQTGISNALHPRPYGLFLDDLPIHIRPDLPAARVQT